jgi:chemotaxis family two-component system response regulator Rcp1
MKPCSSDFFETFETHYPPRMPRDVVAFEQRRPHMVSEMMMEPPESGAIEILLVEDTKSDAERTMAALREGKVRNRVVWVQDGEQALQYLFRTGSFSQACRPDLILLDWWLPRMNGSEVLDMVKKHPELRRIPVVVMTSSDDEQDILNAYNHYVNCYVTKPVDLDQFIVVVKSIESFWFNIVKLPAA